MYSTTMAMVPKTLIRMVLWGLIPEWYHVWSLWVSHQHGQAPRRSANCGVPGWGLRPWNLGYVILYLKDELNPKG